MEQPWPPYVDEHATVIDGPPERVWPAVKEYVDDRLRAAAASPVARLLGTRPRAGFEVFAEEPPHRLTLAGRHRFSRYVLDVRLLPAGAGTRVTATTYAEFPGPHGYGYRLLVIGTRLHVVATRGLLRDLRRRVAG